MKEFAMNRFQLAIGLSLCFINLIGAALYIVGALRSSALPVDTLPVSSFTLAWTFGLLVGCFGCFLIAYAFPKAKRDDEDFGPLPGS
ncbi:MAG: hypothetical protein WBP40_05150 [Candidatus Moraniibacteriota bacterium]